MISEVTIIVRQSGDGFYLTGWGHLMFIGIVVLLVCIVMNQGSR